MSTAEMPEVTVKEALQFRQIAGMFLRTEQKRDTKLYYAVEKVFKKLTTVNENFIEAQQDLQREHAMVDEKTKKILKEGDQYQYTKEDMKALQTELRKLAAAPIEGFKPHFVSGDDVPKDLSFSYDDDFGRARTASHFDVKSAFEKFVLKPEPDEED